MPPKKCDPLVELIQRWKWLKPWLRRSLIPLRSINGNRRALLQRGMPSSIIQMLIPLPSDTGGKDIRNQLKIPFQGYFM